MMINHTASFSVLIYYLWTFQSIHISHVVGTHPAVSTYTRAKSCNFQDKLDNACVEMADDDVHTSLNCARHCSARDPCEGFTLDVTGKCYLHFYCVGHSHLYTDCSSPDMDIHYFIRRPASGTCLSDGQWDTVNHKCTCAGGFLGARCERYAESCKELKLSGQYGRAFRTAFHIKPLGFSSPARVYCLFTQIKPATTFIIRNQNLIISWGFFSFNRSWNEYVHGFFDTTDSKSDGWIGLEKIYYMNVVEKLQTLVIVPMFKDNSLGPMYTFHNVSVGNSSTNYQLSYESVSVKYTNTVQNASGLVPCLSPGSPVPFSTPEVDNDLDPNVHCAKEAGAGWWFSECNPRPSCNPLGIPYQTGMEDMTPDRIYFGGMDMRAWASNLKAILLYFK